MSCVSRSTVIYSNKRWRKISKCRLNYLIGYFILLALGSWGKPFIWKMGFAIWVFLGWTPPPPPYYDMIMIIDSTIGHWPGAIIYYLTFYFDNLWFITYNGFCLRRVLIYSSILLRINVARLETLMRFLSSPFLPPSPTLAPTNNFSFTRHD